MEQQHYLWEMVNGTGDNEPDFRYVPRVEYTPLWIAPFKEAAAVINAHKDQIVEDD